MLEPPARGDVIAARTRRAGTAIGAVLGGVIVFAAAVVTGIVLYQANGEQHAAGPAFWGGSIIMFGGPIALIVGAVVGRRIGWRIGQTRARDLDRTDGVPPRPDLESSSAAI
jgi:hypothetical protein